jgi:DNA-binding NarL/FixJ family response regulator
MGFEDDRLVRAELAGAGIGSGTDSVSRISVMVVDDHPVVRYGVVNLLNAQRGIRVIAEAGSYAELEAELERIQPEVLVLDLQLGDAQGTEALERLRQQRPDLCIVVYSAYDNEWCVVNVIKTGVQGYVLKGSPVESLCEAIGSVAKGDYYLDAALTSKVMGQIGRKKERRVRNRAQLTDRESDVLTEVAAGKRNKDIAETLHISERTVKFHVSTLFKKLRATNRTELAKVAVRQGLVGH